MSFYLVVDLVTIHTAAMAIALFVGFLEIVRAGLPVLTTSDLTFIGANRGDDRAPAFLPKATVPAVYGSRAGSELFCLIGDARSPRISVRLADVLHSVDFQEELTLGFGIFDWFDEKLGWLVIVSFDEGCCWDDRLWHGPKRRKR